MIRFPEHSPVYTYSHSLRSRYGETDRMGYVYYGRYLDYFEAARTEMIRELGLPYKKMEDEGIMLPVVDAALEYKSPIHYDEQIEVIVLIYDIPLVRLYTFYKVFTERSDSPHVLGKVTLAFSDAVTRRPCRAPENFLKRLRQVRKSDET
jgi:acyl-CoA thioester hydrolase